MDKRQHTKVTEGKRTPGSVLEAIGHLHRLSSLIASDQLDEALSAAVEIPVQCLGICATALLMPSRNSDRRRLVTSRNLPSDLRTDIVTLRDDGLIGWVLKNNAPRAIDDLTTDGSSPYLRYGLRSAVCAPVECGGETPGAMLCVSRYPTAFAVWEVELVALLANQVSAIVRRQESTPASDALPSPGAPEKSDDADDIVSRVLEEALAAVKADGGSIMAKRGNHLRIIASRGLRDDVPQSANLSDGTIAAWVATNGKPLMLNGRVQDDRFSSAEERPEIVSAISVPLRNSRNLVGVLNVHSTRPWHTYTNRELGILGRIAGRVALGIEYARLFEQSRLQMRHLRSLYRVARAITSTLDLGDITEMITQYLREHMSADVCALLMYDRAYDVVRLARGHSSLGGPDDQYLQLTRPAVSAARRSKRPVEYHDLLQSPEYAGVEAVRRLGLRSGVVAALSVRGNITGFVAAFRRKPHGFERQAVKVLPGLAELAAIALENARLYQRQADIAHMTRKSLMPLSPQEIPGFDIGCKYAPAYQVGGDFYDIVRLPDGKFGIAIADVAGKDTKAAAHIGMCRHSLRAVADEIRSPAALIQKMNRLVCEQTEPDSFISMIYAVLDPTSRRLAYCSAGHEPALVYRHRSRRVDERSTHGLLLGILPRETYRERRASIQVGDIIALYTDGLVDALATREMPGVERLKSLLIEYHALPMQQIADLLHDQASAQSDRSPDDIALILLKAL